MQINPNVDREIANYRRRRKPKCGESERETGVAE